MRHLRWVVPVAALVLAPVLIAAARPKPVPFADARLIVEVNATDGDAGLQIFVDADPWKQVSIHRPDGQQIVDFRTAGPVDAYGLTELFSESSEPPFTEFTLDSFKALFPAGQYAFSGTTIDGTALTGTATLSHHIPNGPEILSPADGARVDDDAVVVKWSPGTQPVGVDIRAYQVVVTRENPHRVLAVDLPASVTSLTLPEEFLESRTAYALEVLAIEAGGNQTLTEMAFTVK
jgi:hypothetical protein